jgi:enoyl-CoA hydratase/carnithine racemase
MLTELGAAFAELRDDATVRVVVVTGAPPVFSAGADAGLKGSMSAEERRRAFAANKSQFRRLFERANTLLEGLEQVTIAAVNGHAVGGGWGLALACDFRLVAAEAQFWIPEVDLGVPSVSWDRRGPRRSSSSVAATRPRRPGRWASSTAWCRAASSRKA